MLFLVFFHHMSSCCWVMIFIHIFVNITVVVVYILIVVILSCLLRLFILCMSLYIVMILMMMVVIIVFICGFLLLLLDCFLLSFLGIGWLYCYYYRMMNLIVDDCDMFCLISSLFIFFISVNDCLFIIWII